MTALVARIDALHEQATQATGFDDFGPAEYMEPLKLLLSDFDRYERFDAMSEQLVSGAIVLLLISRLFAQQGFKKHPALPTAPIEKPLIILGMPRTGSTALQKLLSKDPANQWITPWLGNTPMPRPPRGTWESNPWYRMTAEGLKQFYGIFPQLMGVHPMIADEADECRYGIEPSFWSPALAFAGTLGRDYAQWILQGDARYAYRYYRKILGLIAGGDQRRWLLKDPTTHPWAPRALIETFPDANFVYTHREPVTAIASMSAMLYVVRHARTPGLSPQQNAREQLAFTAAAVSKLDQMLQGLDSSRVFHVHINELNADPVGTAQRIYQYFNLPVTAEALTGWQQHVATDARAGHGLHQYTAEELQLNPREVYDALGAYTETYRRLYGAR
ncbi:MAG: sulfotransferase [Steroidobacteraceae bacterium]